MTSQASENGNPCRDVRPFFTIQSTADGLSAKLSRREPIRILAIGSSSTEGVGATSSDHSYPAQLEDDLAGLWNLPVSVVNAGKGGETAIQTIERLEAALRRDKFDLVIWQVGTNDAINGVTEDAFRTLLERGVAAVKGSGTDMILLDQQYFPTIKDLARYERFVQAVSTIGSERKVPVLSRYALMKEWKPEELRSMLSADGFHMGDKGYDCLADCVADAIQAMVRKPEVLARPSVEARASIQGR